MGSGADPQRKPTMAVAVRSPMPGMVRSRCTSGSCLASALELVLDASALVLELSNLGARITQVRTEHVGQIRISVFDELGDGGHDEVSALGDEESELAQDPAYGIDACGPCGEPS